MGRRRVAAFLLVLCAASFVPGAFGQTPAPPRRVKHVSPVYPEEARAAGIRGSVVLKAIVSATGQVTDATVVQSIPALDKAAIDAVRQWEYTPTIVNGVAVPVIMTVTVQFAFEADARPIIEVANALYEGGKYKDAAAKYEEALALDPSLADIYFFLGHSYDSLYEPTRRGDKANDAFLTKAIENYQKSAEMNSLPKIKKLALEYLVAAHGPDKMAASAQAERFAQQLIQLEPNEPTSYFVLAKVYEDNGFYEKAEATYLKAKEVKPDEPTVYTTLAAYYNRQGDFEKMIDALQQRTAKEPKNSEAHHMVATYYWEKVYRDFRLADADKRKYVKAGIDEADKAIALKNDYFEAIAYKSLLLRLQADLESDMARQQALIREAERLRDQALELRAKQQGDGQTPAVPR